MSTESLARQFNDVDRRVTRLLARHSLVLLRISIGIVFLWFGALKLVPGMSPAEPLIRATITFLPMNLFLPFLAVLEMTIGLGFITGKFKRLTVLLLLGQMAGAMSPIVLAPDRIWADFPFVFTLEGQYVVKDIILVSAGLVIGATARGGGLTSDPVVLRESLKRGTQEIRALFGIKN
ncbi:MAG: DoxX family protein [Chloroflexota bacterium]|nr:MAG: hypothetical protein DIU68_15825 [Chloroflexota bacterium]